MRVTDDMIESLVCPPPPTDPPVMSEEMITGLIVPAPGWSKYLQATKHNFVIYDYLTKVIEISNNNNNNN